MALMGHLTVVNFSMWSINKEVLVIKFNVAMIILVSKNHNLDLFAESC